MAAKKADIAIVYKYVGGAHFFSSNDERAQGLCVANRDLRTAFNEVGTQLKILAKENRNEEINLEPAVSFDEFQEWLMSNLRRISDNKPPKRVTPSLQLPWHLSGRAAA